MAWLGLVHGVLTKTQASLLHRYLLPVVSSLCQNNYAGWCNALGFCTLESTETQQPINLTKINLLANFCETVIIDPITNQVTVTGMQLLCHPVTPGIFDRVDRVESAAINITWMNILAGVVEHLPLMTVLWSLDGDRHAKLSVGEAADEEESERPIFTGIKKLEVLLTIKTFCFQCVFAVAYLP